MTLDVEGQGINYKVHEPAAYPLMPTGLRFVHFFMIAPIAGLCAAIGLLIAYIFVDPRIRFLFMVEEIAPVISVIPRVLTPTDKRIMRTDMFLLWMFLIVAMLVYVCVAVARMRGIL